MFSVIALPGVIMLLILYMVLIFVFNPVSSPNYYAYVWSDVDGGGENDGPVSGDWLAGVTVNRTELPTSNITWSLDYQMP